MNTQKDTITEKVNVSGFKPLDNQRFLNLKLNLTQKEIIFGSLLGDMHLQTQSQGKSYWMRIQQNLEIHGPYVLHLFNIFQSFCSSLPDKVERIKNKTTDLRFQTRTHEQFFQFGEMFYGDKKKHLPSREMIFEQLTPIALSYWYMDDGAIDGANPRGCSFNTHGFTDQETQMLIDILNEKYQLNAKSRNNKRKKIIVLPAKSCDDFNNLVKPHTIKSMYYKLPGQ